MRNTHHIDATNQVLGRLATHVATLLRGKHKASFQPYIDAGDMVVVSHVAKVRITGKKITQKKYYRYSGYPGGLKTELLSDIMVKEPSKALRKAVYSMLPHTRHRTAMMKRLSVE